MKALCQREQNAWLALQDQRLRRPRKFRWQAARVLVAVLLRHEIVFLV